MVSLLRGSGRDDAAPAVPWLLSDAAGCTTGAVLQVTRGR
jgi:hypothetical protein